MSVITPEWYNDFDKTSYINQSYIPETFCVRSVDQYIIIIKSIYIFLKIHIKKRFMINKRNNIERYKNNRKNNKREYCMGFEPLTVRNKIILRTNSCLPYNLR